MLAAASIQSQNAIKKEEKKSSTVMDARDQHRFTYLNNSCVTASTAAADRDTTAKINVNAFNSHELTIINTSTVIVLQMIPL